MVAAAERDAFGGVRERLNSRFDQLSRQQRKIASYLLDHLDEVAFLSVPELAERSGVSEATVVRLCQAIGYSGFITLKRALVDALRDEGGTARESRAPGPRDALGLVAEVDRHNIRQTVERVDRQTLSTVSTALFRADHIYTYGLGVSSFLADFAAYQFTEHGLRSNALGTHFSSPREPLVTARPGDLLLVFSFPPYSGATLDLLDAARDRGLETVAITDRLSAPAARRADHALEAASDGALLNNSSTATILVLNALLVDIADRHRGETVEALSRISDILDGEDPRLDEEGDGKE